MARHIFALGICSQCVKTRRMRSMWKNGNLSQTTINISSNLCTPPCAAFTCIVSLIFHNNLPRRQDHCHFVEDKKDARRSREARSRACGGQVGETGGNPSSSPLVLPCFKEATRSVRGRVCSSACWCKCSSHSGCQVWGCCCKIQMRESLGQTPGPRMRQDFWYSLNAHGHLSVSQPHLWVSWGIMSRFWMVSCRQIYYKQLQGLALKLILQILQPSHLPTVSLEDMCLRGYPYKMEVTCAPSPLRRLALRAAWPSQGFDMSDKTLIVSTQWEMGVHLLLHYNLFCPNRIMWFAFPVEWEHLLALPSKIFWCLYFISCCITWHVRSYFPDQGTNQHPWQ